MRIIIADDHEIVVEGLLATLASLEWVDVVGTAATGADAVQLVRTTAPDVAVIDLRLPDVPGDALCRDILAVAPDCAIIILSSYLSEETVRNCLRAGARAYITKAAGVHRLKEVLEQLRENPADHTPLQHAPQLVEELAQLADDREAALRITPQQERILELMAEGLTTTEMSQRLFISQRTVRFHLEKLKERIGARSRPELIAKAMRLGVIPPAPEAPAPRRRG